MKDLFLGDINKVLQFLHLDHIKRTLNGEAKFFYRNYRMLCEELFLNINKNK